MSTSQQQKRVIIFGSTGAVGTALAEILSSEHPDWTILAVTRNTNQTSRLADQKLPNVTMIAADSFDKQSVLNVTKDCDMIFCCIGFHRYERKYWSQHWPVIIENMLAATGATKKFIFCDNLYSYGAGTNISPNKARVPASHKSKPAIRTCLFEQIHAHMQANPGTVTVVGGADFFGPYVTDKSFLGDTLVGKIVNNEAALAIGSADVIHDFCYVTDFARALAVASVHDRAYNRYWICPHTIHNKTVRQIANDVAVKAGKSTPVKIMVLGGCTVRVLSPFMGFMGEMIEMLPFWANDYTIDDSDFIKEFGIEATPYEKALQDVVDFYLKQKSSSPATKPST